MPNMRTATDVEIAEANAAMELAYRELTNDILGMFDVMTNGKLPNVTRAAARVDEFVEGWDELVRTFGALPRGELVSRDIPVPKNTDADDDAGFTRRTARTVIESDIGEKAAKLVAEDVVSGKYQDTTETLESLEEKSKERITADTLDAALAEFNARFDERVQTMHPLSSQEVVDAVVMLRLLDASGRNADIADLAFKLAQYDTWAGRAVSAIRLLKLSGNQGFLSKLQYTVDQAQREMKKRKMKFSDGDFEIPDDIRDKVFGNKDKGIPKLDLSDDNAVADVEAEFIEWLAAKVPARLWDKFTKWRYVSMLFNPLTWERNFVGNALMGGINAVSKLGERGLQRLLLPENERTTSFKRVSKETREFAAKSYAEIEGVLRGNVPTDLTAKLRVRQLQFKNGIARMIDEYTDAAMNGVPATERNVIKKSLSLLSDSKFLKLYYTGALEDYITAQGLDVSEPDSGAMTNAKEYAMKEALRLTFREQTKFAKMWNTMMKPGGAEATIGDEIRLIAMGGTLPFTNVPANIGAVALNMSPLGLIYDTYKLIGLSLEVKNDKPIQLNARAKAISKLTQSLVGNLLLGGLGVIGALTGVIRIRIPDDDKGRSDYASGRRTYSLEIFGHSFSIGWAAPFVVPLFIGAAAAEAATGNLSRLGSDNSVGGVAWTVMMGMLDPLLEMQMVKGVTDIIDGVKYSSDGGALALSVLTTVSENYFLQSYPAIAGRIASATDDLQRRLTPNPDNDIPDHFERLGLSLASKIPGLRNTLEPKVDAWGRPQSNGSVRLRIINNFLLPTFISKITEPEFDRELERLYETFSYKKNLPADVDIERAKELRNMLYPSIAPQTFKLDGESGHRLDDKEYTKLAKATGKLKYELANEFINSDVYEQLSDVERAEGLDKIYRYANSISRYEMFGDRVSTTKSDISAQVYAKISGLSVGEWVSVRSRLTADAPAGSTDEQKRAFKADKAEFLIGLGLSDEQTYFTAENVNGFGVTTENLDMLIDNKVPPAEYFEMYAKYGNNYKPAADPELIRSELRLNGQTAREYWNRAAASDLNLGSRVTGKLNAIQEISGLALGDDKKIALASALGIGVNANDIQEALDVGISADDALRYAVMQDAYASISKAKGNSSSLTAMMFAIDGLDDPKYTAEQKATLYNVFPMYQIIPVNADVEDIEGLKKAGVKDWLPLRAKWVELGENGDEDSAKNYKYALWLYRESGHDVKTQEIIGKAVNSSAYQSSDSYAKAVYKGAVLESYGLWSLWNEWTDYKRGLAKANGKTSISSVADINTALGYFERKRGKLTDTEKRVLFAVSTGTKASTASVVSWGKEALGRLRVA
jgi:hypothetical protein